MRTGQVEVNGKTYLLCFSARVVRACAKRYGNLEKLGDALTVGTEVEVMDENFWLLAEMMAAGAKYAKEEKIENPEPLDLDRLYDLLDLNDILRMQEILMATIAKGNEREVETEPEKGKNVETTLQDSLSSGMSGMG